MAPWVPALLGALLIVAAEQLVEGFAVRAAAERERASAYQHLAGVRARLESVLNVNLLLVHGLSAVVAARPDMDQQEFAGIVRGMLGEGHALRNLAAAPNLVISMIYPVEGNTAALGLDYRNLPQQRDAVFRAVRTRQPVVAGPLALAQGGMGIVTREAVYIPSRLPAGEPRLWGTISGVIDVDVLYRLAGLTPGNRDWSIALRGADGTGASGAVFFGDAGIFAGDAIYAHVRFSGGSWQLALQPTAGWGRASGSIPLIRLLGGISALLVALLGWRLASSARALAGNAAHMRSLLDTLPDLVWLKNVDGVYLSCNRRFAALVGRPQREVVGHSDVQLFEASVAAGFRASDHQAIKAGTALRSEVSVSFASDGSAALMEVIKTPVRDPLGRVMGVLGVARDLTERREAERRARMGDLVLDSVFEALPDLFFLMDLDGTIRDYRAHRGGDLYVPPEAFLGRRMQDVLPAEPAAQFRAALEELQAGASLRTCLYTLQLGGDTRHYEARLAHLSDTGQLIAVVRDTTSQRLAQAGLEARMAVLDGVAGHAPRAQVLGEIALRLERLFPGLLVAILVRDVDSGRLRTGAAPSLPAAYTAAADDLEIRVGNGSCGSAAALGETVVVADIQTHEWWRDYREIAASHGLRSCWSIPFRDDTGNVLGTFGLYSAEVRAPKPHELELLAEFARLAGLAVDRVRSLTRLRQSAAVFESTSEGVVITDMVPRIIQVNRAYTEITGYPAEEVIGRNPGVIASGRQDRAFYEQLWRSVRETGHWRGEIWNRRKNGEVFPQILTVSTVRGEDGKPEHYVGVMTDISQIKQSEERLERLAHYDMLTDLPNRLMLLDRLTHALASASRRGKTLAALFIDVDHFKNINDGFGHPSGDEVLQTVARRMSARLRKGDTLGRLGGDEFLVVLEDLTEPEPAERVAEAMMAVVREPISLRNGREVYVSLSVGISLYPDDAQTATELIQHADAAMYQAKSQGRNTFRYYSSGLARAADARLALDARMRRALENGEFLVHYQPQVDVADGRIVGCEALVRWQDPLHGLVSPGSFIPLAEETGFIAPLGQWVLREACREASSWLPGAGATLMLSVNLSGRQLQDHGLVAMVAGALAESGLPASQLRIELTESTVMSGGERAVSMLRELRALGVALALDDFGTGYTSMQSLSSLPIDELKIDIAFMRGIPADAKSKAIALTIITLARELGLRVVAEGVERPEQLAFLRQHGCDVYQGYLFSPAVAGAAFDALVAAGAGGHDPALTAALGGI